MTARFLSVREESPSCGKPEAEINALVLEWNFKYSCEYSFKYLDIDMNVCMNVYLSLNLWIRKDIKMNISGTYISYLI